MVYYTVASVHLQQWFWIICGDECLGIHVHFVISWLQHVTEFFVCEWTVWADCSASVTECVRVCVCVVSYIMVQLAAGWIQTFSMHLLQFILHSYSRRFQHLHQLGNDFPQITLWTGIRIIVFCVYIVVGCNSSEWRWFVWTRKIPSIVTWLLFKFWNTILVQSS